MKLLTNFTIFATEFDHEKWLQIMIKDLQLILIKYIKGCHKEAPRVHYHLMCVWEHAKPIKYLNQKILRIKNLHEEFKDIRISTTFTYEDNKFRSNPKNEYDENVLMYALKEYNFASYSFHDEVAYSGFSLLEIENYRKEANKLWERIKVQKTKEKKNKISITDMYEYIDNYTNHITLTYPSYGDKKREILKIILEYKRIKEDKIYTNQLKDLIINYLYSRKLITEYDIIESVYL